MQANLKSLKQKYQPHAIERAGCWLLAAEHALSLLLEDLASMKVEVYGIEGYWLQGEAIRPDQDNSLFLSGGDIRLAQVPGSTSLERARNFVRARQFAELHFDLDLVQHEENAA